jgi:hypothetical protein
MGHSLRTDARDSPKNAKDERVADVAPAVGSCGSVSMVTEREATIMQATIPPSVPAKRFPLEECSALIIRKYAPWLKRPSVHSNLAAPLFQICSSW